MSPQDDGGAQQAGPNNAGCLQAWPSASRAPCLPKTSSRTTADKLLALLADRFGGTPGTSSVTAFEALHTCARRRVSLEDYVTSFDEAVAQCVDAGLVLENTMRAHFLLKQAGLSELERSLAVSTAGKANGGDQQFKYVANMLLVLFPMNGRSGGAALVTEPAGDVDSTRGGSHRRRTGSDSSLGGAPRPGGLATC